MSGASRELLDAGDRRVAVTDFERNLVVEAGAGTGKTSLLVERLLNAIGSGEVDLDSLAAITFTEKAAAEMRERVAAGLEELRAVARGEREPDPETPAGRAFGWLGGDAATDPSEVAARALAALERIDRARILTIHAFCAELLRAHPVESGVDPDFQVDTGEQAAVLAAASWEEFLAAELGARAGRAELWGRLLGSVTLDELHQVGVALGSFAVPDSLLRPPFDEPSARDLLAGEAGRLSAAIDRLFERAQSIGNQAEPFFDSLRAALAELVAEGLGAFQRRVAADPPLARVLDEGRSVYISKKVAGVARDEVENLARECRHVGKLLYRIREGFAPLVVEAVAPFALRFREQLLRRGWVSFDGLLALSRDLLRDVPAVRQRLKRRYRMLLIDEFQDTDPLQYEIVLFLGERDDDTADDAYAARLAPGKLFVVGDPKQSIYRFRGADYEAFRRAVRQIVEGDGRELTLSANFRSVPGVVEPINAIFGDGSRCWTASEYQPDYQPIEAWREQDGTRPRVELWTLDVDPTLVADVRRRQEGELIAETIESLVARGEVDGYSRISILFRTFSSIPQYLRPLRERRIPFVVDGGKEFLKRPEIAQSLAVLRTLAQPSDPTALLAFLRSPAGGISDSELADYAAAGLPWDWRHEPREAELARIGERFALLRRLRDETRQMPADSVVRHVVESTQLLPLAAAAYEGAQRVANLQKLVAAGAGLARDGRLSLEDVVDQLQEGGLADLEGDSPLADDAADAVRITSIHKMKGLENDWVVLPDLAREDKKPWAPWVDVDVARLADGQRVLALKIGAAANPGRVWHDLEAERHEQAEETRVLYVALTRARERLVLCAVPSRKSTRWFRALAGWGYDPKAPPESGAFLLEGTVEHRRLMPPARARRGPLEVPSRGESALAGFDAAVQALVGGARPPFRSPSALEEELEERRREHAVDAVPRRYGRSRDRGKAVGIVVHRLLEHWAGADRDALERARARVSAEVAATEDVDREWLAEETGGILRDFLASPLAGRLERLEVLGRELPLLLRDADGQGYRGSIDLVYRDAGGAVVVADYKTDLETDDALLARRYGGQLGVYAEAVRCGLGLDAAPRRELWLLRAGRVLELDDGGVGPGANGDDPRQLSMF